MKSHSIHRRGDAVREGGPGAIHAAKVTAEIGAGKFGQRGTRRRDLGPQPIRPCSRGRETKIPFARFSAGSWHDDLEIIQPGIRDEHAHLGRVRFDEIGGWEWLRVGRRQSCDHLQRSARDHFAFCLDREDRVGCAGLHIDVAVREAADAQRAIALLADLAGPGGHHVGMQRAEIDLGADDRGIERGL